MMQNFHNFANTAIYNSSSPDSIMLNGNTTFVMSQIDNSSDIMKNRMKWIVNNFVNYDNVDKRPYYEYYKSHIYDNYVPVKYESKPIHYKREDEDRDDIDIHYADLNIKYSRLAELNAQLIAPPTNPYDDDRYSNNDMDYEEEDNNEILELEYESDTDYDDDYDINDEWDEYLENEYYEDDDYDW
jgi:hypothetical protein